MMPRYLSDRSEYSRSLLLGSKEAREKDEGDRSEIIHVAPRGNLYKMCEEQYAPRRNIVLLYARLGLHRYNFLQGKNLQLSRVEKFLKSWGSAASTYFITLKAKDPETSGSLQTFQAHINEQTYGRFLLKCTFARPLGDTKKSITDGEILLDNKYLGHFMPELPPENPFKKTDRFYVLKKSEIRHNDWIRLYLELAVATTNRHHIKHGVNNLKILKVAMEITRNLEEPCINKGLGAFDAIFYIRYKDSCKGRAGEDVDRVAIIRRIWDEQTEVLGLVGRTQSSQTIKPSNGSAAGEAGSSSAQD